MFGWQRNNICLSGRPVERETWSIEEDGGIIFAEGFGWSKSLRTSGCIGSADKTDEDCAMTGLLVSPTAPLEVDVVMRCSKTLCIDYNLAWEYCGLFHHTEPQKFDREIVPIIIQQQNHETEVTRIRRPSINSRT